MSQPPDRELATDNSGRDQPREALAVNAEALFDFGGSHRSDWDVVATAK